MIIIADNVPKGDKTNWTWQTESVYTPLSIVDSFDNSPEWLNGTETDPAKFDISDCDMTYYGNTTFASLSQGTRIQKGGSGYCIQTPTSGVGVTDGVRAIYKTAAIEAILNGDIMGSTKSVGSYYGTNMRYLYLIFRYLDTNNYYYIRVSFGSQPPQLTLNRVIGGVLTTLSTTNLTALSFFIARPIDIRVIFLNNTYYIYYCADDEATLNASATKAWTQATVYTETTGGFINPGRVGWQILDNLNTYTEPAPACVDDFNVKAISVDTYDGS